MLITQIFGLIVFLILSTNAQQEGRRCRIHTRDYGTCKKSSDCKWLEDSITNGSMSHDDIVRCGFQNDKTVIVCCANSNTQGGFSKKISEDRFTARKTEAACRRYSAYVSIINDKILGGVEADEHEFPHMAVVGRTSDEIGTDYDWFCGGSLISERYVLTAAHCTTDRTRLPGFVRLNDINLSVFNNDELTIGVLTITNHPDYRADRKYNDIALLKLQNDVTLTYDLFPACLWTGSDDRVLRNVTAIGFGVTNTQVRRVSNVLMKTQLAIRQLQSCNQSYISIPELRTLPNYVQESMVCAHDSRRKNDTCDGDSGGPLQTIVNDHNYVIGVTSFGIMCASSVPSIYTRVSYYLDWIESIVWS